MTDPAPRPLTEAQSGLWYAQRLDPANPVFNTGQYLDLRGPLDVPAFRAAVDRAGEEADALALRIVETPDGPVQWVDPALRPRIAMVDLTGEPDPEAAALAAIRTDMATPIDPARGPLATQTLYRLGEDRHVWAQRVHHLAIDGYGTVLLTGRVAELYRAAVVGGSGGRPLAPLAGVWEEDARYLSSAARGEDAGWWRDAMAGGDEVAGMAPGRAVTAHNVLRHEQALAEPVRTALLALADRAGAGWPDVLTALVAAYCRRFVDADALVAGVPHMGRFGSASARVPAMVMNVLPIRIAPDEDAPVRDYVATVAARLAEARRHGRYRSEQLRRDLGLLGGNRRLYGPLINVQPYDRPPTFAGLRATLHVTGTGPVDDIHFTFRGNAVHGLTLEVEANPDLYDTAAVAAHGTRLEAFLTAAGGADTLAEVATATAAEAHAERETFNATAHPVPDTTLTALIERTMRETPDTPAIRFEGTTISYAELDGRSAALAAALRGRGVGAEAIVAVALPRSVELVVALVAVLRAGGAYLPLDADHPPARLAAILESASPTVVLAPEDPHALYGTRLLAPRDWPGNGAAVSAPTVPDDAAYVIYTSGSTGEPKGVVITHRAIVNRLLWMAAAYRIGPADRILQKTPATFDVSVWEFFLPLVAGATLVVASPGAHRDPAAIAGLIRGERITALHFVPSMLAAFLDSPASAGLVAPRVFCSGEELPADLRDRFHARVSGELHNLYGPTEAAVDVSFWPAGPDDTSRPVPIGRPVWNTRLLVLDGQRRPLPPGVGGQLYLGGVQLARGYLGRPDLTAERFIADPADPTGRLYATGDLARRRPDGAIEFLGRADHQVKVRGLRIELGEIEAALLGSRLASTAVVIARNGRIIAYVVPAGPFEPQALRAALTARLPDYMVPSAIVALDRLPLSANGKLDRTALPDPVFESAGGNAPATATERRLAGLYAEVLGLPGPVSAADDFFTLGGDSLGAVRLGLRIAETFGHDPGLAALFERPDVAGLAALIDRQEDAVADGLAPLVVLTRGDPALAPLFLVHPAGGLCWGYRTLAAALEPPRTVYGLQSPALDLATPAPATIATLAMDYADRVEAAHPDGTCHLAGWSVGGIIAHAVAAELAARGREVGLVALLDSYPAECWRAEPEPSESQAMRALLAVAGYDPEAYPHLVTREAILDFLRTGGSPLGNLPRRALDGVVRVVLDTNRLVRAHHHRGYVGTLTHVRAAQDHGDRLTLVPELWLPHAAGLDRIDVPFLHPQLTGAAATRLIAPALADRMAASERVPA